MSLLQMLIIPLAWLALPVILVVLYDVFVLAPQRPKTTEGETVPGPGYVRVAHFLLPFVIVAAVLRIGVGEVFAWAKEVAQPLSWLAIPVGLWCAIDSWILAPRRIAAQGAAARDPVLLRVMYAILPVLVIAIIVRLISAETLDFSLVLLVLSVGTGAFWGIDHLVFRTQREQAAKKAGPAVVIPEPGTVDYARSFVPVAAIVLIVRAFIFEPFRIPSDSMMPTLHDGDFIVVSKFSYGLRLPVLNQKFIQTGSPQRGDVVVFRKPGQENVNYIKRLVGLPGDRIEVKDDHLVINGQSIVLEGQTRYDDGCYHNMQMYTEKIGEHTHRVFSCRSPYGLIYARTLGMPVTYGSFPACNRSSVVERVGAYVCEEPSAPGARDTGDHVFQVVPDGQYLMIGDNRDNSEDSRVWGLVPEKNLVGKATRIWLNFDPGRPGLDTFNWRRIGDKID